MYHIQRVVLAFGALLMALVSLSVAPAAHAQNPTRICFAETNQCVEGRFLQYWQQNGGLSVFGYPITPAREEPNRDTGRVYLTQWFQRNRFELHPEYAGPYDVLLGRLGDDMLLRQGRDWRSEYLPGTPGADCETLNTEGAPFLLCPPFRDYYRTHGLEFDGQAGSSPTESLALFGLPLTQPRMETNSSGHNVLTQWFERARFEWHPTNPEPYKVLLGLLGNEVSAGPGPVAPSCRNETVPELRRHYQEAIPLLRPLLGCPTVAFGGVEVAEQFFEHGVMIYRASTSSKVPVGWIDIIYGGVPVRYRSVTDLWAEGQPETAGLTPPPGRLEPKRGFGKVWREEPGVREALGWATTPERGDWATLQFFDHGVMIWLTGTDFVYTFISNSDAVSGAGRYR